MRFLGIDYGTKKIGLALSDEGGSMAFPHSVIPNDEETEKHITSLVEKENVEQIVVGHSLNRDGNPNKVHEEVEALVVNLTLALGIPIHLEPEQYTTQEAERIQGKHDKIDASAAAIILNSYFLRTRTKNL